MNRRGRAALAFGTLAILIIVAVIALRPQLPCPTIGYAYVGDVELTFTSEQKSVAACFGDGCTPQPVNKGDDGKWSVPQRPPYLLSDPADPGAERQGHITFIRVAVGADSNADSVEQLPVESESTGEKEFWHSCPGPSRFKPVHVPQ